MHDQARHSALEDPLSYLPRSVIEDYGDGEVICDFERINTQLHLVIEGYVNVTRRNGNKEIVISLCQPDDFFGETSLVQSIDGERASAIGHTRIMSWTADTIADLVLRQPKLGVALAQMLACRCVSLESRIIALSADSTVRRLAKALLTFAQRWGEAEPDEPTLSSITSFSHELLAKYIGSSRAAVTRSLIRLRRGSLIKYSRKRILVDSEALRHWLHDYNAVPAECIPSFEK